MAHVPKDDEDRVRRNAPKLDTVEVEADEFEILRGFDLPEHPNWKWTKLTQEWWEMWRRSPQAKLMEESDWWSLLEAAMIHHELWRIRTPAMKPMTPMNMATLMSELRRREDAFGATWEARQRLRLKIKKVGQATEADKVSEEEIVNYFDNLDEKWRKEEAILREKNKKIE